MEIGKGCAAIVFSEGGMVQFKADTVEGIPQHVLNAVVFYLYLAEHHDEIAENAPPISGLLDKLHQLIAKGTVGRPSWN